VGDCTISCETQVLWKPIAVLPVRNDQEPMRWNSWAIDQAIRRRRFYVEARVQLWVDYNRGVLIRKLSVGRSSSGTYAFSPSILFHQICYRSGSFQQAGTFITLSEHSSLVGASCLICCWTGIRGRDLISQKRIKFLECFVLCSSESLHFRRFWSLQLARDPSHKIQAEKKFRTEPGYSRLFCLIGILLNEQK